MSYLTEPQEVKLRRLVNELPERRPIGDGYPARRLRGTIRLPSGQVLTGPPVPAGSTGATMHTYPFVIKTLGTKRSTISTPMLQPNIYILDFTFKGAIASDPPSATVEIGAAAGIVTETQVALTIPRPYAILTELLDPFGRIADDRGFGYPINSVLSPIPNNIIPLGLLIAGRAAAVTVSVVEGGANAQDYYGHIRVLEGLDPAQPPPF